MSTARPRTAVSTPVAALLVVAVVLSFGYAFLTTTVFAWGLTVAALALSAFALSLLYRLVRAVERIADELAR